MPRLIFSLTAFLIATLALPMATRAQTDSVQTLSTQAGVVVSDSPVASAVGAAVLKDGGNAVDAAVATAFAMAVTWPEAGNIGGGGFMLVASPTGDPRFFDYRETAPAASTVDMYTPGENRHRARHAGTPGTVAGLWLAHEELGTETWPTLVQPAIDLARDGFAIDQALADSMNAMLHDEETQPSGELAELRRVFGKPGDGDWQEGDVLKQPDLARTLERIRDRGRVGFYQGDTAQTLETFMKASDGIMTARDLADYRAVARTPIHSKLRGYDVYGAPPPSSGGISVALILNQIQNFPLENGDRHGRFTTHMIAEAMRRAFFWRALRLGDPDHNEELDIDRLLSGSFAAYLCNSINPRIASKSNLDDIYHYSDSGQHTTHFSVIDANGMAVANTYTLEESWGSRVVVPGLGFVLNNEMGDFNWVAGRTTEQGAIGTRPNLIEPGKRMLSSMSPTIVKKDGKVVLVTGSPGGRTIINTVACIVLNRLMWNMSPADAVDAPRMHHQWMPDTLYLEEFDGVEALAGELIEMGHDVKVRPAQGSAHSIFVDGETGEVTAVVDRRRGGGASAGE